LTADSHSWSIWYSKFEEMLTGCKLAQYLTGTKMIQHNWEVWQAQNSLAKHTIVVTIHPSLAVQIYCLETTCECFETLRIF
ncbi:hypothetical protein PAXRUDRAFT_159143, partial [Paxillus rubicundulus Ve08.2h10]